MSEMDVSAWKSFRVGDLFDVIRGKSRVMRNLMDGDTSLIAAARANQGVAGTYDLDAEYHDSITVSCNGAGCGSAYYHDGEFAITGDAVVCVTKEDVSKFVKMFITAVFDKCFSKKFSYAEKCGPAVLSDEFVKLPATPVGTPDWDYMENYMRQVMEKEEAFASQLESLSIEAAADGHEVDVSKWGEFRVGDLFEKLTLKYKGDHPFQKALDLSDVMTDEFNLPLVNAKLGDNGVMYYGRESDWESAEMTLDIVEDGAASVGTVYAQPQLTGVLYNAYLIKPKVGMTANCLLFISAVMECCIKQHFSYSNKCTWAKVEQMLISLPVTPTGTPDWAYMEQFMQQQMDKSRQLVEHLDQLI